MTAIVTENPYNYSRELVQQKETAKQCLKSKAIIIGLIYVVHTLSRESKKQTLK